MPCEILKDGRVDWRYRQLAQLYLRRRPRQVERPLSGVKIVIPAGELERAPPIICYERGEGDGRRPARLYGDASADGKNRIQNRAHRAAERTIGLQRDGVSGGPPAPDEAAAIGLEGDGRRFFASGGYHVHAP